MQLLAYYLQATIFLSIGVLPMLVGAVIFHRISDNTPEFGDKHWDLHRPHASVSD